jgi:diguanylate cyclase (GGDEF)-like protein
LNRFKRLVFRDTYRPETEPLFEQQSLARLRTVSPVLGLTGLAGAALAIGARALLDDAAYTGLRLLFLPAMLLLSLVIYTARSVRIYGLAAAATMALLVFSAYLGSIGLERPLLQFLPGLLIVALTTSFFWINFTQWAVGNAVCYAFLVPFVLRGLDRVELVNGGLYVLLSLAGGLVAHYMMQDYRRSAFVHALRLSEMSATDALTGIHNRRQFLDLASRLAERLQYADRRLCLLYLDIDHFKSLNDRFGHAAGDVALKVLASRLEALVRPQDVIGRLGGEEFAVALPECLLADALALAERVRAALALIERPDGMLSVSVGVAQQHERESLAAVLHRADLAMLQAKESGRNTVKVAPPGT